MRRNAESLLVLASAEPPRRWTAPVRLTDVVRSALGEVEDYTRADITSIEPVDVVGAVAGDLAHLLAELIENALQFSPGRAPVTVRGMARPHGDGYILVVLDDGRGMSDAEIEAANRRLAGDEAFTVAPSTYLGHYVAGRLAARHGISVRLDSIRDGGVAATVQLPPSLVVTAEGDGEGAAGVTGVRPLRLDGSWLGDIAVGN
jgi:signal transduction histidine kinase